MGNVKHKALPDRRPRSSGFPVVRSARDLVTALNRAMANEDIPLPPCQTERCKFIRMCATAEMACDAFAAYCGSGKRGGQRRNGEPMPRARIPSEAIYAHIFPGANGADD